MKESYRPYPIERRRALLGQPMPPFTLPDASGGVVTSEALIGRGPVVIYFYPKDETPLCTAEACAFRDQFAFFQAAGATVLGVSADDATSHARFATKHRLPFLLLSDGGGEVAQRFGVARGLGFIPGRDTFVIDRHGIVRGHVRSLFYPERHLRYAVEVVKKLAAEESATRARRGS